MTSKNLLPKSKSLNKSIKSQYKMRIQKEKSLNIKSLKIPSSQLKMKSY